MTPDNTRPDWVMLGTPNTDGSVTLFASVELSAAELTYESEWFEEPRYELCSPPQRTKLRIFLTVEMKRFLVVRAATYGEALARMMDIWSPDQGPTTVISERLHSSRGVSATSAHMSM